MVRVALTGTPGTGKTTVAGTLAARGWRVVDAAAWAADEGAAGPPDEASTRDVDVDALAKRVPADDGTPVVYEAHWSHFLGLDEAWVLRCDPEVLRGRLADRGYSDAKLRENVEAEALDLILQEALDHCPRVIQRDATRRTPSRVADALVSAHDAGRSGSIKGHDLESVDWSDRLPIW